MTGDEIAHYRELLAAVQQRITSARSRTALAVNAELIRLYWDVGKLLDARSKQEGWGAKVITRLASDIRNDLPDLRGFSEVNLRRMLAFYQAYSHGQAILSQAVTEFGEATARDQVPAPLTNVPWGHHIVLLYKVKDPATRAWYLAQIVEQGWSRSDLTEAIERSEHARIGRGSNNFGRTLPPDKAALAERTFKDPYVFDFLTLDEKYREAELEADLIRHVESFLVELGQGFAFVGRQVDLIVGSEEYRLDMLFYHLKLRAFVVIELKAGKFAPEFAGKLSFYCSVVDDTMRHDGDQETIGLLLCKSGDQIVAEYALRPIDKPLGLSTYDLTRVLPGDLKSSLPTIDEIEAELS